MIECLRPSARNQDAVIGASEPLRDDATLLDLGLSRRHGHLEPAQVTGARPGAELPPHEEVETMRPSDVGRRALVGWRMRVGEALVGPLSRRTPLSADRARVLVGALFFGSSLYYVVATLRRAMKEGRG